MILLISLGHNSSAVLVDKQKVVCGYEEERLSKVKSDSSYPKLAIEEIIKRYPDCRKLVKQVCVSHWFWITGTEMEESKYWQPKHISVRFPNASVKSVNEDFTHHDAHAGSVWNFSQTKDGLTVIADGFGTNGETLSVYRDGELIHRGFDISLGLMYQYMTSHLGMKENQDEYKMLGLESEVNWEDMEKVDELIKPFVVSLVSRILSTQGKSSFKSVKEVCSYNKTILDFLVDSCYFDDVSGKAYAVQSLLELCMSSIIEHFIEPEDDILQFSGGVFYNVKLNNVILNSYADKVDVIEFMPLAGDQGAPLGMVDVYFDHLFWGERTANYVTRIADMNFVMSGNMEFGPRALGNTSCIAPPTAESTTRINELNGRPDIMPMAPMISSELAHKYCLNIAKLGRCKHYMICATDWLGPIDGFRGVLHNKPGSKTYTCRPQVIDNNFTSLDGIVINTSLNAHGQPILFSLADWHDMKDIHEKNNRHS
jgi:carbamoyltransferase